MDKRIFDDLAHLATVEACHDHIRHLQSQIERLELAAELNPIRGDRPYKALGYHRARRHTPDDGFGVYAEFQSLAEAVTYCQRQIDEQIAHSIAEAKNGLLTTARQIDDAIAELMHTGWIFWVSNVVDPCARDAFVAQAYARDQLTEAVLKRQKGAQA